MTDPIEAAARAMCFAPGYTLPDGELIKECDCASADECFEINGPLKAEMIGKARAVIAAYHKANKAGETRYREGFRDGIEAAANFIQQRAAYTHRGHARGMGKVHVSLNEAARLDSYAHSIRQIAAAEK